MSTKSIHEAKLASVTATGDNSASFVVEPLVHGYGRTLGNSLRRVLLSSIKGAAITSFNIEGANHEFTAIPGIREDVVDIMLNLKNIRFKLHDTEMAEVSLEIKGSDQTEKDGDPRVVAGDIKLPANVEIGNPKQVICHIDDPKFTLRMRFIVESGRGYMPLAESAENRIHSDMIALDAVFTPVLRVRYEVESTRVGRDTNLDKLILNVTTDGTITPSEAFEEAAAILVNQYTALAGSTKVESTPAPGEPPAEEDPGMAMPIEDLGLSARTTNALLNNEIKNVRELVALTDSELRELKGFGTKALDEVKEKLTEINGA